VVQTNDQRYLSFALDQIRATVTTLTLNADDIIYTINRSVITLIVLSIVLTFSVVIILGAPVVLWWPISPALRAWQHRESSTWL
jgi:hypothetical protein